MHRRHSDTDVFSMRILSGRNRQSPASEHLHGATAATGWVLLGSLVALCALTLWGTVGSGPGQSGAKHPILPIGTVSRDWNPSPCQRRPSRLVVFDYGRCPAL